MWAQSHFEFDVENEAVTESFYKNRRKNGKETFPGIFWSLLFAVDLVRILRITIL